VKPDSASAVLLWQTAYHIANNGYCYPN